MRLKRGVHWTETVTATVVSGMAASKALAASRMVGQREGSVAGRMEEEEESLMEEDVEGEGDEVEEEEEGVEEVFEFEF